MKSIVPQIICILTRTHQQNNDGQFNELKTLSLIGIFNEIQRIVSNVNMCVCICVCLYLYIFDRSTVQMCIY